MSRKIRVGTISLYLPEGVTKLEENVERAIESVNSAIKYDLDIICLPECYTVLWSSKEDIVRSVDMADEINKEMQNLARKGDCYLISNILEREAANIYNSAFVIDRNGIVIGKYSKTHLAPFEHDLYGNIPGSEFPVFKTDFGTIAVMICMDIYSVEVPRIYGIKGAEILFWPTQAYGPSEDFLITLLTSRAIDNQMYCVASNFCKVPYHPGKEIGRACIIGLDGKIRADTGNRPGIAVAEIDLEEQVVLDWGYTGLVERMTKEYPNVKTMINKTRRPELYKILAEDN